MLRSSYKDVRTTNACSNILIQSCTAHPISSNPIWISLARCSLTSRGVEGCAFNCSSTIWIFSSSWTFVVFVLASWMSVANLWIHSTTSRSARMANSRMHLQVSFTTYSNHWVCDTSSSHYRLSCLMFIFCSLRTCITRPSLLRSSVVITSYNCYSVSHGKAIKLRPSPLILSTAALSISFSATSSPSVNTMVLAILVLSIYSVADVPAVT